MGTFRRTSLVVTASVMVAVLWTVTVGAEPFMALPEGYVQTLVHRSAPAGPMVASHSGDIYMKYAVTEGGSRISRIDPQTGDLTAVLDLPPWNDGQWLVGGPQESFFMVLEGALVQVDGDGTMSTWSEAPLAGSPRWYTNDGRMIGASHDETAVVELKPDGSAITLATGFEMIYDLVVADDGTIYVADFPAEELVGLSSDGSRRTVVPIAPDNTNLALDPTGNLYLNNAAVGFNRVDTNTGSLTPIIAPLAQCRVIPSPAIVVFEPLGRALFFSWVDNAMTWADPTTGMGGRLIESTWANTTAADVGQDAAIYVGISGCGATTAARVMRVTAEGSASVRASTPVGNITGLAVTASGGVFVAAATETSGGLYYAPAGDSNLLPVPGSSGDVGSLATYPYAEEVLALLGPDPVLPGSVRLGRFSPLGMIELDTVALPEPVQEFTIDIAPDGTVYAQASEALNFFSGPVKRWLLRLDLYTGTHAEVFRSDRSGCCPFDSFAVDFEGILWWVLNPDFVIYRVDPAGGAQLFATQTPVDAGYVNRTSDGDLFINAPEGLYRVWQPSQSDRIDLLIEQVDQLVFYNALSRGRARALSAQLEAAAAAADQRNSTQTVKQIDAFLRTLNAYIQGGILSEAEGDYIRDATHRLILPFL